MLHTYLSSEDYFGNLVSSAITYYDNEDKAKGISECYTSGRTLQGLLNGTITPEDIEDMVKFAEHELNYKIDTIILPEKIWLNLLRLPVFQTILLGSLAIVPTRMLPYNKDNDTSSVVVLNSQNLNQTIAARSVKIKEAPPCLLDTQP